MDVDIEKIKISEDFDCTLERESDINLLSSVSKSRQSKGIPLSFYKTQSVIVSSHIQGDSDLYANLLDDV